MRALSKPRWASGRRLALALLTCTVASCQGIAPPVDGPHFPPDARLTAQEGEVTVWEGDELLVRYPKVYQAPPRLVLVEFRQSWTRDNKPYSRNDILFLDQKGNGFKVVNNHPGPGRASVATIKWRAEGVLAAEQPAATRPAGLAQLAQPAQAVTPEQLVEAIKAAGGSVAIDPVAPTHPVLGVDLHHTRVTDAELALLAALPRLRSLTLSGTAVTDASLNTVAGLSGLQTLLLNETRVTDAGLVQLQRLPDLKVLSLYHTQVTDEGLAALKDVKNLQDLTLSGPRITDRGLAHLAGVRNLRHLYLSQTGVSKTGAQQLKKALPKVEIVQ
jgi:hypothetical protein